MNIDRVWPLLFTQARHHFLYKVIERVVVGPDGISITISGEGLGRVLLEVIEGTLRRSRHCQRAAGLIPLVSADGGSGARGQCVSSAGFYGLGAEVEGLGLRWLRGV